MLQRSSPCATAVPARRRWAHGPRAPTPRAAGGGGRRRRSGRPHGGAAGRRARGTCGAQSALVPRAPPAAVRTGAWLARGGVGGEPVQYGILRAAGGGVQGGQRRQARLHPRGGRLRLPRAHHRAAPAAGRRRRAAVGVPPAIPGALPQVLLLHPHPQARHAAPDTGACPRHAALPRTLLHPCSACSFSPALFRCSWDGACSA